MEQTSRLYDELKRFLGQHTIPWQDQRHLQTLSWMVVGILHSGCINLNQWGVYTHSKAQYAQSHQRRFRRWLGNRRIDIWALYAPLITAGLSEWGAHRLYLSLDTTLLWNQFCIVWLAVVYRGRTVPVTWCV